MEIALGLAVLIGLGVVIIQLRSLTTQMQALQWDIQAIQEKLRRLRSEGNPSPVEPTAGFESTPVRAAPVTPAVFPAIPPTKPVVAPAPPPLPPLPAPEPLRSAPPPAAASAPEPAWIQTTRTVLRRIWNWLLVNEEHRPTGVSMEFAVATTWLIRAGVMAFVVGIGFFLKWSIDRQLFPPAARVAVSLAVGVGMILGGFVFYRRQWMILGQGLMGGAFAVLYFSLYAAGPMYHLLESPVVFGLMILVTLTAGVLAVSCDSMLIAILGIIGGYATPVMLSTGQPQFAVFYSYLLLLGVGVLVISHFRAWRLLNYLAFLFTYGLYAGAQGQYRPDRDFPVTLAFLILFFALHSFLCWWHTLRRAGERAGLLEILHLILNAGLFALSAYDLVHGRWGRPYPALVTLGLALFYIAHVAVFLARPRPDRPLTLAVMGLAGCFAILTLPLAVEKESLTLCWALMAGMLVWLGHRLQNRFMRMLGHGLLGVSVARMVGLDLTRHYLWNRPEGATFEVYRAGLIGRLWTFGGVLASLFACFRLEWQARAAEDSERGAANDLPVTVSPSTAGTVLFWLLCAGLVLFLQLELSSLARFCRPAEPMLTTLVWCGMGIFLLSRFRVGKDEACRWVGVLLMAIVLGKTLALDFSAWRLERAIFHPGRYPLDLVLWRWLDFMVILVSFGLFWAWLRAAGRPAVLAPLLGYGGLSLLFLFTSLEINSSLQWFLPGFRAGGLSVYWTFFALALLTVGIVRNIRLMRYAGLAVFLVVIAKVFLSDLQHMAGVYRILASMGVGVLLILGSLVYLRAHRIFVREENADGEEEPT